MPLPADLALERGRFELRATALEPEQLARRVVHPACGAVATFSGTARDHSRGRVVVRLEYEAYAEMVEAEMARIFDDCRRELGLPAAEDARLPEQHLRMLVEHRVGSVPIGAPAVAIAVAAPHRERAFAACRFLIDTLKQRLPIWKKEVYADGSAWIGERP
ncbi:MAG: molybdenum cofactor biosynthesis protein MoaE [Planctomycetes bacterium]|nr:molybdenum cofactor biosynthesis protein MoaE [Planctomycetota bacterium]